MSEMPAEFIPASTLKEVLQGKALIGFANPAPGHFEFTVVDPKSWNGTGFLPGFVLEFLVSKLSDNGALFRAIVSDVPECGEAVGYTVVLPPVGGTVAVDHVGE